MSYYEYRVVPAPRELPKVKGVKAPEGRFAHAILDVLNIHGREGWEFQRSETLTTEVKRGWLSKSGSETMTVLIFRRWVEIRPETDWRETAETPEALAAELPRDGETPALRTDAEAATRGPRIAAQRGDAAPAPLRPLPGLQRD